MEEISIKPAGNPDANVHDRQGLESADSKLKVRKRTRMARNDIDAQLRTCGIFNSKEFHPVTLIDISQLGAAVTTDKSLRVKAKVQLKLMFRDGAEFTVNARVARAIDAPTAAYGLSFLRPDRALNDHLLKTGLELKLKT